VKAKMRTRHKVKKEEIVTE